MKLSPSTIAANLSAAAAAEAEAEAEAAASSNLSNANSSNPNQTANNSSNTNSTSTQNQNMNNQQQTQQQNQQSTIKVSPKDFQVVVAILNEMGIMDYEPRVIPQLSEFAYRYISKLLEDAQTFSMYARKKVIDTDDISLALNVQIGKLFVGPPSRDTLLEITRNKNNQPLPSIKSHNGMRLPADRYSLVVPTFRFNTKNNQTVPKPIFRSVTSLLSGNSFVNTKISLSSINSNRPSTSNSNNFSNDIGTKRKIDDN